VGAVGAGAEFREPESLSVEHELEAFDCGEPTLNDWLKKRALYNHTQGASRTYVACIGRRAIGYYCLATGGVTHSEATGKVKRNMPNPIPVIILGRLAVDLAWQGKQMGGGLLKDAALRSVRAAEIIGVRALIIHALSDDAKRFYERYGFIPSPGNPMMLMATITDLAVYFK
jgi:GNAT superfamily N-acetyltransferase